MGFALNERWLMFATWGGDMHSTSLCSGNLMLEEGVEAPLPLTAPTGGDAESQGAGIPVAILVPLGVAGVVAAISWLAFRRDSATPAS